MKLLLLVIGWGLVISTSGFVLMSILTAVLFSGFTTFNPPFIFAVGGITAILFYFGYKIIQYARK